MSRCIYNIDLDALPVDGYVLRKNSDASLTLQIVGIKYLIAEILSLTEEISRQHHLVHKCSLTVVYMCNNCDISDILHTYLYKNGCKGTNIFRKSLLYQKKVVPLHPHFGKSGAFDDVNRP